MFPPIQATCLSNESSGRNLSAVPTFATPELCRVTGARTLTGRRQALHPRLRAYDQS